MIKDKDLKKWELFLDTAKKANPELIKRIQPQLETLAKRFELNRAATGVGFGKYAGLGSFSGATIQAGAMIGKVVGGVSSAMKSLKDTGVNLSGISAISHATKDTFTNLAKKHAQSNPRVGRFFENLSKIDSPTRKRALLFSASQNPGLRESIEKIFKSEKSE